MALNTYADLALSIAAWMDRTDLAAVIPDFVALFEATANAELPLRTRYNLATANLTTTAGLASVTLPDDFLEAKGLVNQSNPKEVVTPFAATALYTAYSSGVSQRPKGFTYVGHILELAPVPDAIYTLKLYYYQKVTPLSALAPTNWLLANFPNLYLFGSLVAAEAYLGADARLKLWGDLYETMIQKLSGANERGQYGGAPLSVKMDTVA